MAYCIIMFSWYNKACCDLLFTRFNIIYCFLSWHRSEGPVQVFLLILTWLASCCSWAQDNRKLGKKNTFRITTCTTLTIWRWPETTPLPRWPSIHLVATSTTLISWGRQYQTWTLWVVNRHLCGYHCILCHKLITISISTEWCRGAISI